MTSLIQPRTHIALRLPSGVHKVIHIIPDTTISLGKFGSFYSNSILGRPYYLTFEILDQGPGEQTSSQLRVVPASELNAEALEEEGPSASESRDEPTAEIIDGEAQYDIVGPDGEVVVRNNRLTVDSTTRQKLTTEEIEQLKLAETGSGKAIIAKIMESHTALDEKTAFSLAKYTLRKSKKYLRRFTVLPMDVPLLANYILNEKDAGRIMDLREEMLGLIASWSNVHSAGTPPLEQEPTGRWLVVDDTAGLIVALLAERMGILHEDRSAEDRQDKFTKIKHEEMDIKTDLDMDSVDQTPDQQETTNTTNGKKGEADIHTVSADQISNQQATTSTNNTKPPNTRPTVPLPTPHNTITLLHTALQPNVSFLNYFSFDPNSSSATGTYTSPTHPLHTHLRTLTWLELLSPETSTSCTEPETATPETLASWKSSKRGNYYRKRRRWERTHATMLETRAGGFDGLVVASSMDPASVLRATVPLLKGGAPVVVYSASVQPLVELVDVYSGPRKTAYLNALQDGVELEADVFPVDPRLLLAPSLQTARAQEWQVLPGRTHPLMTGRGGSEGYLFTATRVLPAEGNVQARGRFAKKRKVEAGGGAVVVGGGGGGGGGGEEGE